MNKTLLYLCVVMFTGCASVNHPNIPPEAGTRGKGPILEWVDEDLATYIESELSGNARFVDSSVLLVKLDGEEIAPEIDALSEDVRDTLFDRLVASKRINLARRFPANNSQHPRTLANVNCGEYKQPTHYVGWELRSSAAGGYRASVRALDIQENEWVSGFGQSWAGTLSERELVANEALSPDKFLRGLRPLPFDASMADLTTNYLANNLSCLIRDSAGERLTMYIQPPASWSPKFFTTVTTLLTRYMNTFREVEIVGNADAADAIVDSEIVQINDELWQVWAGVEFKKDERRLSGADTPAYISLDPVSASLTEANGSLSGSSSSNTLSRSNDTASNERSERPWVQYFRAVAPSDQSYCEGSDPWQGSSTVVNDSLLPSAGCFAIEASASGYAHFLIAKNSENEWFRLAESSCQVPLFSNSRELASQETWRFPDRSIIKIVGGGEAENFYLVAVNDQETYLAVKDVLSSLPDRCQSVKGLRQSPLEALDKVSRSYVDGIVLRRLEVRHSPSS